MFLILTRILLWILVGVVIYAALNIWLSKEWKAAIGTFLIVFIAVGSFYNPNYWCVPYLWEILAFFLKPLGLSLTLIYLGTQKEKKGKNLIIAGLLILLISSIPFLAYKLAAVTEGEVIRLIRERAEIVKHPPHQTAEAIVLIGRGTTEANLPYRPQIQLTDTADRITYTAQVYHQQTRIRQGYPPLVIVSAGLRENLQNQEDNPPN
jgi:hypothetical protein